MSEHVATTMASAGPKPEPRNRAAPQGERERRYFPGGDPERAGCCPNCRVELSPASIQLLAASLPASEPAKSDPPVIERLREVYDYLLNQGADALAEIVDDAAWAIEALETERALASRAAPSSDGPAPKEER